MISAITMIGTKNSQGLIVNEFLIDSKIVCVSAEPAGSSVNPKNIKNTEIGSSLYKSYGDAFYKCDPNKPSRTVKENHGGVFLHYKNNRCMTPRELAELQSFPKDFIFKGSKSFNVAGIFSISKF